MGIYDTAVYAEEMNELRTRLMTAIRLNWQPLDVRESYKPLTGALAGALGWLRDYGNGEATLETYFAVGAEAFTALAQWPDAEPVEALPLTGDDVALADDLIAYLKGDLTEKTPRLIAWEAGLRAAKAEEQELRELGEVEF